MMYTMVMETLPLTFTLTVGIVGVLCLACPHNFGDQYDRCLRDMPFGPHPARFLEKVLTTVKRKEFDRYCKTYTQLIHCTESVVNQCPENRAHHEKYFRVSNRVMPLICSSRTGQDYRENIQCIVSQRRGPLAQRCDQIFNFKKLSRAPVSACRLNEDLYLCKDRLIRSACGSRAADVSFQLNKIVYEKMAIPATCNFTMSKQTDAFAYNRTCRPSFPNRLNYCSDLFREKTPRVYKLVPVLIRGDTLQVDIMCKAEREYRSCVASVESNCPLGAKYVEETFQWRLQHDMARYVCSVVYDYKIYLPCLQRIIEANTYPPTTACESKRNTTVHLLKKYYYYKCSDESKNKLNEITRASQDLITCFYNQVYNTCNKRAADILRPLLEIKYGLHQFRLNCDGTLNDSKYSAISSAAGYITHQYDFGILVVISVNVLLNGLT